MYIKNISSTNKNISCFKKTNILKPQKHRKCLQKEGEELINLYPESFQEYIKRYNRSEIKIAISILGIIAAIIAATK